MACPKCGCKVHYQYDSGWDGEQSDENLERCAACGEVFDLEDAAEEEEELMEDNNGGAFYAPDTRNRWQRLLTRLFPAKLVETPEDAEGFAPGYMRTDVRMHLDLRDRLRTLVSGKLRVVVVIQTDVTALKVRSDSTFWVEAPWRDL